MLKRFFLIVIFTVLICSACDKSEETASIDDAYDMNDAVCHKYFDCVEGTDFNACVEEFTKMSLAGEKRGCIEVIVDWISCLDKNMKCVDRNLVDENDKCAALEEKAEDCED
jgi:hypothetical protein